MTALQVSVMVVVGLLSVVYVFFLPVRGRAARLAARRAQLEQCRLALRDQPLRPITCTHWFLDGPSDLIWGFGSIPALFVACWMEIPSQLVWLSALLLFGLLLYNRRRSKVFELAIEGTRIRWGWAHQRDRQRSIDLRHTLLIAHTRVEATGSDSGSYWLSLDCHLEDGTSGHFPGECNLRFVQEFLLTVNHVRPGVAPSPACSQFCK
jgi:hypothetical protein